MFSTIVRRMASEPISKLTFKNNPYKTKKVWPPDFSKLSPGAQLKFEKRYKRRLKLASARPNWHKFIQAAQLCTITFVVVYSVLFLDWKTDPQPFEGLRKKFREAFGLFDPENRGRKPGQAMPSNDRPLK